MTDAQRRAINRQNARKSTGPITPEGKERTRQNALKHGLCAEQLVLSIEDADELQEQFDDWIEEHQPVGRAEFAMVEEIAKSHLKLQRCARREVAVIELQLLTEARVWCHEEEDHVHALRQLLATEPTRAVRELLRIGAGRRFLKERWERLGHWFLKDGYCDAQGLVDEGVRLLGGDPQKFATGPVGAYNFALCCAGALPTRDTNVLDRLFSDAVMHPEYLAELGRGLAPTDLCRQEVRRIVTQQIEMLEEIDAVHQEDGAEERYKRAKLAAVCVRAQVLGGDPESKHALRYESQARSALHRALKELDRLQNDRYAAEAAAAEDAARNEADTPPGAPPSVVPDSTCDASEDKNPEEPNPGAMPTSSWACPDPTDMPTKTWACHPPEVTIVTIEGADSPPA